MAGTTERTDAGTFSTAVASYVDDHQIKKKFNNKLYPSEKSSLNLRTAFRHNKHDDLANPAPNRLGLYWRKRPPPFPNLLVEFDLSALPCFVRCRRYPMTGVRNNKKNRLFIQKSLSLLYRRTFILSHPRVRPVSTHAAALPSPVMTYNIRHGKTHIYSFFISPMLPLPLTGQIKN